MLIDDETWMTESGKRKTMLVIDDDEQFLENTSRYFRSWTRIQCVPDVLIGLIQTIRPEPDLILLNCRSANIDCSELCQRIRDISDTLLFVFADDKMMEDERIACFEAGADDIWHWTQGPRELMLRIQVLNRRGAKAVVRSDTESILNYGPLRMDCSIFRAFIHEKDLLLTRKEFSILWELATKPAQIISRREMLQRVWNINPTDDDRMIDTHLNRLRQKLHPHSERIRIITAWGIGYKLELIF